MKNPDTETIDNRMEWNMRCNGILCVTLDHNDKPTLLFEDGSTLYGRADKILFKEFYRNGEWPTCPITGKRLPGHEA